MKSQRLFYFGVSIIVACLFVFLWKFITAQRLVSPVFLPAPDRAWASLARGMHSGVLMTKWLGTLERMVCGWLLASLGGIALGAVIGVSERARAFLQPSLEFMRPLPASAVVPLAISLLGLSEAMVLSIIAFGAIWPMLLATVHGFAAIEPRLYEVSRSLGLSRTAFVFKIALPSSMPDILAGMRLSLTISLILAIVGEMLASRDGLGNWIFLAARTYRTPDLFAGVILLGVTGLLSAVALSIAESWLLKWRISH